MGGAQKILRRRCANIHLQKRYIFLTTYPYYITTQTKCNVLFEQQIDFLYFCATNSLKERCNYYEQHKQFE